MKITASDWASLDALSLEQIAEWGKKLKPDFYDRRWEAVMIRWASLDGKAAMAHANSYGGSYSSIKGQILACWIANDQAGAAAETAKMGVGGDWEPAFATLVQADLTMALDVIYRILKSAEMENVRLSRDGGINNHLGAQLSDPVRGREFQAWLEQQPNVDIAMRIFAMAYSAMKHEGAWLRPERLPDYLSVKDQIPPTLEHPDSVWAMGAIGGGENPLSAVRKKELAPHPRHTDAPPTHSIVTRLRAWASQDPESAGLWLVAQEPWPDRDGAIQGYISLLGYLDPVAATKWAGELSDPGARVQSTAYPYSKWHRQDSVAAEAWIERADFSDLHRNYIRGRATVGR